MKYYIGMDGGGTKTKCVLADENLKVISTSQGGPSNFLIRGTDEVSKTLFELVNEVISGKIDLSGVKGIVLGTTGAGRRSDAEKLETAFKQYAQTNGLSIPRFRVESDARIALEGAFSGKPGSILIAGTGSILFGKDAEGTVHRIGGFGRMLGDEGSGYSIGKKGLSLFAKEYDGRGITTLLTDAVKEKLNIPDGPSLINEVYNNQFDIASVTPLVIECAAKGDEACISILEEEADELILHVTAISKKMDTESMRLCLIGSLITTDNYYSALFKKKTEATLPNVKIQQPDYEPEMGAVLMAM